MRNNYICWEIYFMNIAELSSQRSKDPKTQVGACVVNDNNRIIGIGYNGMPNGCDDNKFPWGKGKGMDDKRLYVCHAEINAFLNSNSSTKDCSLYSTLFPCNECAKVIIQSGIKRILYKEIKKNRIKTKAARKMFLSSKIKIKKLKSKIENIQTIIKNGNND